MKSDQLQDFLSSCRCDDSDDFLPTINSKIEKITANNQFKKKLEIYQTLGNKTRYLVYNLIKEDKLCTCAIAEILHLSQGTISHHIKKLVSAGLIVAHKEGYFNVYYVVNDSF